MQKVTIPKPFTSTSENNNHSLKKSIMKKSIKNFENKTNSISNQGLKHIKGGTDKPKKKGYKYGGYHVTILK